MAPVAPSKRRSLRAKLAAKSNGPEPHAPRKAPRPDAVAPSELDVFGLNNSKRDKRSIRHSAFVSRIEKKAHAKPALKRRRPSKKLVANLESLADALPDLLADGETEEGLRQLREGKVRHKSLKSARGALRKKERIVKGEMDRFGVSLAKLNAVGAAAATAASANGGSSDGMQAGAAGQSNENGDARAQVSQGQSSTASTSSRWAALRGFINATMEQNPAFIAKQDEK